MTPKKLRFVDEFVVDLNATQAAIRAGFSAKTARAAGCRLLTEVDVQEAIAAKKAARSEATGIDAAWVLKTLHAEKTADLADLYDEHGNLRPIHQWPEVWRRGPVVGIESFEEYSYQDGAKVPIGMVRKVKFSDRTRHLELIGKHTDVQAFREKVELTGKNGGPVQTVSMTPDEFRKIAAEVAAKT